MKRLFVPLCILSLFAFTACRETFTSIDRGEPSMNSISIAYAEAPSTYSPLSYEAKNRKFLSNIYESLVRFDGSFNIDSSLAVSWGRVDETTWDFHLRSGVFFHDGRTLSSADVLYSLTMAMGKNSELNSLLSTIASVEAPAPDRITITTVEPDPLLLNRLTFVSIFPDGTEDFSLPLGTGPYRVHEFAQDDLVLERFNDYWGPLAYFPEVHLRTIADPDQRIEELKNGTVQVLANVPPQYVNELEAASATEESFPSLEVSYLMLNQKTVFVDTNLRKAVWFALSNDYSSQMGGGYLESTSQYAATGIEGYSSTAEQRLQDREMAAEYRALLDGELTVTLDVPQGVETLGEAIKADLAEIDITVEVNVLSPSALQEKIIAGQSDFYFFGWKYDLADSADFLEAVVHSPSETFGEFNGVGYQNVQLDALLEKAATELNLEDRRADLSAVTAQLLEDKAIVPLFEAKTLYAFRAPLLWNLRLDGQLWATGISENVVK